MTKYRCNQCGAEDSDRSSSPPLALICWKCGAGRDTKSPYHQVEVRDGMFPMDEAGLFPWEK